MSFELVEAGKRSLDGSTKRSITDVDAVHKVLDGLTNLTLAPDDATSGETCVGGEDIVTDTKKMVERRASSDQDERRVRRKRRRVHE